MKKSLVFLCVFLVSNIFASWTNKVSDRLLNPQKYFKKQKLRIYKNAIPINNKTKDGMIITWSGSETDKGKYFETELECVVYNTNEGRVILLNDDEFGNIPESPYKGFYRFYRFSSKITKDNYFSNLSFYSTKSMIDNYNKNRKRYQTDSFLKYRKSWIPLSVKMVVKKDNMLVYICNSSVEVDGIVLSERNPLAYKCLMALFEESKNKWLNSKGTVGTFFSNLSIYFGYNEDATKLVVD